MATRKKSITRSRATTIPKTISPMPVLYLSKDGDGMVWDTLGKFSVAQDGNWQVVLPKASTESTRYQIRYAYIGGPNQMTVELSVEGGEAQCHDIEWLYVRTHTGGQIKFIKENQAAYGLFALAEDDAYMFCQNDPCLECAFACKVGFVFFAYSKSEGLLAEKGKVVHTRVKRP